LLLMHIAESHVDQNARKRGLIRLVIFVIPGLLISALMPYMISREPGISVDITDPASSQQWIAPVAMTFSLENALPVLAQNGFHPISYKWDINGDRKVDQETVIPTLTATYDQQGVYTLSVTMVGSNGATRTASKRFIILTSVFGMSPSIPIVEKPVVFSVAGLVKDPTTITSVQWDFDGDNKVDETDKTPQATYTYFKVGQYKVTAIVSLSNKTQASYQRTISVGLPPTLPFPVELLNQPTHLIGSPPFAVLFTINTKEPVADVQWDFGDGQQGTGLRAAHTYTENGNYPVVAKVRSQSGVTAVLNTAVQVVDALDLPDLSFVGSPQPDGDTIQGEVPLTINLTPKTNTAFVQFSWEAPDATEVGTTDTGLQAIYRRDGTYSLTLVAQDLNNHVLRKAFKVLVTPPSALVSVKISPETGVSPLTVSFDASATSIPGDDPTGFIWNFGDGTPETTQGAYTTHTYTIPKTYTIGVTAQTTSGKSYPTTVSLVVRAPVFLACMTRSKENVQAGSSVQFFSDCTTGTPANYLWDFGDKSQSSDKNPVHLYTTAGAYTVQLTIDDGQGNKNTISVPITVQ
jgi:PKD repeat protein